jgi:hypothetical protein
VAGIQALTAQPRTLLAYNRPLDTKRRCVARRLSFWRWRPCRSALKCSSTNAVRSHCWDKAAIGQPGARHQIVIVEDRGVTRTARNVMLTIVHCANRRSRRDRR